jgi:hypothetical protein
MAPGVLTCRAVRVVAAVTLNSRKKRRHPGLRWAKIQGREPHLKSVEFENLSTHPKEMFAV